MKRTISALLAAAVLSVLAEDEPKQEASQPIVKVYRIEVHANNGDETAWLVGGDGEKRPVVLVTPDEFALLTERLDAVWKRMHESKSGRIMLHGAVVRTEIDNDKKERVEYHKDGYTRAESFVSKRAVTSPSKPAVVNGRGYPMPNPKSMSERQFEMRRKLWERRRHPIREVSVEHDATTGKNTVVEGK